MAESALLAAKAKWHYANSARHGKENGGRKHLVGATSSILDTLRGNRYSDRFMTKPPVSHDHSAAIAAARTTIEAEARATAALTERLGPLADTVQMLLSHPGKIILCGMGKSGLIARKIAATLCSTGTPAVFLHPAEAVHGDLGMYSPGDPTILLSKSGSTLELVRLIPSLHHFHSPIISMVGNLESPLAQKADVVLDVSVDKEADPLGIVPTSSSLVTLAMGDALASALMTARGFVEEDFARLHPAGQLGRNMTLTVKEVMHRTETVATATAGTTLREVVIAMGERPLGAACVLDHQGHLLGIVTDGDVRRLFQRYEDIRGLTAADAMTESPLSIHPGASLSQAIQIMEDRPSQISVLPVMEPGTKECLGLLRLHDIYQPNLF